MAKQHVGSDFDTFLADEGLLEDAVAIAVKRVISWQIDKEMKTQHLTKQAMAKKMHTSRVALNRLLDESDTSVTLTTLARAASVLGKRISFQLEDATK
jgi:uncharacterized protein YaaW (UPF0174 family)